jgi:hypothetical protein
MIRYSCDQAWGDHHRRRRRWPKDRSHSRLQQEGSAAMANSHHLPFELDTRQPDFQPDYAFFRDQSETTKAEMDEMVAATKRTIAASEALIAECDRILERR